MNDKQKSSEVLQIPMISQDDQLLINAQHLHSALKSSSHYRQWIHYRINEYQFQEGVDYFVEKSYKIGIGRKKLDYHLTLDMAKELAMLERNETGRQIRRYFIAAERKARGVKQLPELANAFRGLPTRKINDRVMLPYKQVLAICGYSTRSSSSNRRNRYWMHFIKEDNLLWITTEFAEHLYWQKHVMQNRQVLRHQNPVLPMNFGDGSLLTQNAKS